MPDQTATLNKISKIMAAFEAKRVIMFWKTMDETHDEPRYDDLKDLVHDELICKVYSVIEDYTKEGEKK